MIYTLNYEDYSYDVESNYQDLLEYEFEKEFNIELPFFGFYTDAHRKFIADFDYKWFHNCIHEYDYYTTRNYDFLDWLKSRYADEAEEAYYQELDDMDADEWWDNLDCDTKEHIMEIYRD